MKDLYGGPTKCLLVQTKFSAFSFWNYQDVCEIVGAKYPAAPLGLITVAALFPQHWEFRLIDENVEPLLDEHLLWADIVCTGGMLPQQKSIVYTGLHIKPKYRHKPGFLTWLIYMRSFLRVCKVAGFSKETGFEYWKMFFTIIVRNPMGIEAAVNLAAMFIHFQKQKAYIVSATEKSIDSLSETSEDAFNERMIGRGSATKAQQCHC